MLCTLHQQRAQVRITFLADVHLRLALSGVPPSWLQSQIAAYVAALAEAMRIFQRQQEGQRDERAYSLDLLQQRHLGITLQCQFLDALVVFHNALAQRLVFPIRLPALRERISDISLLVGYLIDRYAQKAAKKIRKIDKKTMELFHAYDWPGNIRELQNVVERAVILSEGATFFVDEAWLTRATPKVAAASALLPTDLAEREKAMIEKALQEAEGLISGPTGAAAKLGVPRQTLESKIRKLGINRHHFKTS